MQAQDYERITKWFRGHPLRIKGLKICNQVITNSTYLAYIGMIFWLIFRQDFRVIRIVLVTGISFVLVSIFRTYLSYPRPYEVLEIEPLIPKDKKGKSFPSRHVFSIFIIAYAFYYIYPILGGIFFVAGAALAVIRVIAGIHFPRDVAAGAVLALAAGFLGFIIL